ncbi:MAG: FadR family transcriptional regulator [Sediminimonas qiaohouensis]|uniref:FadR family transcriptional regulator n=1 Tax=Sediminimonas qiaohouensis TaxID=552061 RepID=A0A7C9LSP4_9RHOB|nr:FCD domain-containing protein [Sediminimonas qiaohouensis]MTJ05196.1 FadR family transcriptional regulator [Sediminimonas qiaohouensis]
MPPATTRSTQTKAETRLSRPVQIAEAIKDWVVDQGLQAGDRLPGEADLIERFGMSKGTIREAMRILEAQGLIKTRTGPGGGSFVHEVSRQRAKALLGNFFYFKNLTVGDIYQLRLALEPELSASLAGKLGEDILQELEANIAVYSESAKTLEEEREQHVASLRFHAILAEQSDNPLLSFVIDFMVNLLTDLTVYRRLYSPPNAVLWQEGRDHQQRLVSALRTGNADEARAIMTDHMKTAWTLMHRQEVEMLKRFISE